MVTWNATKIITTAIVAVSLAACGGGGDGASGNVPNSYTVDSGVAQKGPLAQGSNIFINELGATLQPNGKQYTYRTNDDLGTFTPNSTAFTSPYLSTVANGYYYNELTGQQSPDTVNLSGLSQVGSGFDSVINVNVLSSMTVNRIQKLITNTPAPLFAAARAQAQREALGASFIYNPESVTW